VLNLTGVEPAVGYALDLGASGGGQATGTTARAGLASFLSFVRRLGVVQALAARVHLPIQERRGGFTVVQKSLALVAALAAGCRSARDGDFVLAGDRATIAAAGLPRWPHSSQLTRLLRAFRPQHVQALRGVVEELTAQHSTARRRLRQGQRVVIDVDQTAISANGRTYERTARGHLKKKGERGYQATVAFAGDTSGGDDEVLAVFLDPGNAHATWRFTDLVAALERVLGPPERWRGLVLRFDCQYATADDLALLLRRGLRFVGRVYADHTAAVWAREYGLGLTWLELSPIKWIADLGVGPIAPSHPELTCRRLLVRSTGARHRAGYTAILTNLADAELPAVDLEPFYEARQTIEGWLSEATAALQLKGRWSRAYAGLEAFLLHAALASNLLNWWERRVLLPDSGLPHLGLRQLIARVITLPARILRAADGRLTLLLPPTHPYARHLAPPGPTWQLPLPFLDLVPSDAHF
jgi:Transposase DDE domain group 1